MPKILPAWENRAEPSAWESVDISLDKSVYKLGRKITVTASNITREMALGGAVLAMAETGRTDVGDALVREKLREGSGVMQFDAPNRQSDFEFRLFPAEGGWSEKSIVRRIPFSVSDAPTPEEQEGVSVSVDRDSYQWGVKITATVNGVSREMAEMKASLVMAEVGQTEINEWISYQELGHEGTNVLSFDAPRRDGEYEFRLFTRGSPWRHDALMMAVPFKISDSATEEEIRAVSVTPDKEIYKQGVQVTVTVAGVSQEMVAREATLTMAETGVMEAFEYISAKTLTTAGTNKLTFDAPRANGDYEFRLYPRNSHWTPKTLMASARFSVSNAPSASERESVSLTLDKRAYLPGSRVTLTVANASAEMASLKAAVTIARAGVMEPHESLASHRIETEGENIVPFAAPSEPGAYEARLFTMAAPMNAGSLIARVPFVVADADNPLPITGRWGSFGEYPGAGWEFAATARDDWN